MATPEGMCDIAQHRERARSGSGGDDLLRGCVGAGSYKAVSRRTERVASLVRSILAEAIQSHLSDPRIEPLTSITRVEVSSDLSVAHVYVSVMAERERRELSVRALRHAAGRLRSLVAREVTLRQAPELDFRLDESVQHSFRTVQQIDRLMEEFRAPVEQQVGPDPGEPVASEPAGNDQTHPGEAVGEAQRGQEDC
jgi:ribosome-binding factor A